MPADEAPGRIAVDAADHSTMGTAVRLGGIAVIPPCLQVVKGAVLTRPAH